MRSYILIVFGRLITPKKRLKDNGLRICNIGSEMVKNLAKKIVFFVFATLGPDQQQHPAVHTRHGQGSKKDP